VAAALRAVRARTVSMASTDAVGSAASRGISFADSSFFCLIGLTSGCTYGWNVGAWVGDRVGDSVGALDGDVGDALGAAVGPVGARVVGARVVGERVVGLRVTMVGA
jgi:hypothetical protein